MCCYGVNILKIPTATIFFQGDISIKGNIPMIGMILRKIRNVPIQRKRKGKK